MASDAGIAISFDPADARYVTSDAGLTGATANAADMSEPDEIPIPNPNPVNGASQNPDGPIDAEAASALILASGLFDSNYYRHQARLPEQPVEQLIRHYIEVGAPQGLDPNPLFDTDWYLETYAHVKSTGLNPFVYYITCGSFQTCPHILFDLEYYLAQNPMLKEGTKSPLLHYYTEGWFAGQDPHPLFIVRDYLDAYPDVRDAVCEPLSHYINTGWREGRNPSKYFSTSYYLANNPDVAKTGTNPFSHYMQYGFREGRDPSPDFETAWYLSQLDPAELKRNLNPLIHYRLEGERRGLTCKLTSFALAKDFSLSLDQFETWLSRLLVACRKRHPFIDELGQATLLLIWTNPDADDGAETTEDVVTGASSIEAFRIRTLTWKAFQKAQKRRGELFKAGQSRRLPQKHVCLFLDRSDRVDARFLPYALAPLMRDASMVVFDFAYESDGRAYPVLQPGANPAYIDATDATFSRFLISADLLASVLEKHRPATPYEIMRGAIQELRRSDAIHSLAHVAVPLLQVRDLTSEIARRRDSLVKLAAARRLATTGTSPFTASIIICTKDRGHLLMQLVENLRRYPPEFVVDITVVVNRPSNDFALACHAELAADRRIRIIDYDRPFNFSDQCNIAAKGCSGELLLFANDDIVPIGLSWLPELAQSFIDPRVAVTGPQLLYSDERVQHAGMYLGFRNSAGHTLRHAHLPRGDYLFTACATRHVAAVTGAVFLTRRQVFEQLNGFDRQLGTYLQDVDFCLRVLNLDMDIVYNPYAALLHMESSSMMELSESGELLFQRHLEYRHFMRKWETFIKADPFHNRNFDVGDERLLTLAVAS